MASGGGKPEVKLKLQTKAHSAVSDLITLEKTITRNSKSREVRDVVCHRMLVL